MFHGRAPERAREPSWRFHQRISQPNCTIARKSIFLPDYANKSRSGHTSGLILSQAQCNLHVFDYDWHECYGTLVYSVHPVRPGKYKQRIFSSRMIGSVPKLHSLKLDMPAARQSCATLYNALDEANEWYGVFSRQREGGLLEDAVNRPVSQLPGSRNLISNCSLLKHDGG
jgi:hypothetical protein